MLVGQGYECEVAGEGGAGEFFGIRLVVAEEVAQLLDGGMLVLQQFGAHFGRIDAIDRI